MGKEVTFDVKDNLYGYYEEDGSFVVVDEVGGTDRDLGKYDVEVMNHDGYYDSDGWFHRYSYDND